MQDRNALFKVPVALAATGLVALAASFGALAQEQAIEWASEYRFAGTFFPAFAISSAGRDQGPREAGRTYGYLSSGSLGVALRSAPAGKPLKVQVEIPEIGVVGELDATTPADGSARTYIPRLSWSQSRLAAISQPLSAEIIFRISVDGAPALERKETVRVRAINDAPLRSCDQTSRKCADYAPYAAAFVNEGHPAIDSILRAALDIPAMPVKSWTGTQGDSESVFRQVWAIWYWLQRSKVTYSSITTVSDARPELMSQTIRPLTQTLRTAQANCIDGTALFASVLRKIGIEPIIVLVPGHAFLGFYTDSAAKVPAFLETTQLNSASNPFNERGPTRTGVALAKMLGTDVHMQQSWKSFTQALEVGQQNYAKAAPHFGKDPGYMLIPVQKARAAGILPLPL